MRVCLSLKALINRKMQQPEQNLRAKKLKIELHNVDEQHNRFKSLPIESVSSYYSQPAA